MRAGELCWFSLVLMWPVSFPPSEHSHCLVRAKVMSDTVLLRIDWACLAQSNPVSPLLVTLGLYWEIATRWWGEGERTGPTRGEAGGRVVGWEQGRGRGNTFNKQTNEWVSWTVMRCFIDAIGKLLFLLARIHRGGSRFAEQQHLLGTSLFFFLVDISPVLQTGGQSL